MRKAQRKLNRIQRLFRNNSILSFAFYFVSSCFLLFIVVPFACSINLFIAAVMSTVLVYTGFMCGYTFVKASWHLAMLCMKSARAATNGLKMDMGLPATRRISMR